MKKILIPFDFGPVGLNAIKYAFELFGTEGEYLISHVIDGNLSLNDPLTYTAGLTHGDSLINEINSLVDDIIKELGIKIIYQSGVEVGSIIESLVRTAKKDRFDFIVMGTKDKHDLLNRWLGTVSLGLIKRTKIPVYLIPKDVRFEIYKRVVVASDYHLESDIMLEYLLEWNIELKADLHFVHIIDDKGRQEGFLQNIVEEFFEKRNLDFSFTIVQKEKGNVVDEINKYAEEKNAQLQIFISESMSWLETMFSHSTSKRMVIKAKKPVLFIPAGIQNT